MNNVVKLISVLKERDIRVSLNGDKLKVSAPPGALTDDIKQQLQVNKEDLLDFLRHAQPDQGKATIAPADRSQPLPLTYSQQRLWILDKLQPNLAAYNMPMAVRIRGKIDVEAMRRTCIAIVERHEILRASLYEQNGTPYQRINPVPDDLLHVLDANTVAEHDRDRKAIELASLDAQTPFNISQGPLFRVSLIRLGDDDHVLLANMHHLVSDGWSMDVLFREIGALYAHLAMGMPLQLQLLPVQYVDFAAWQRNWLDSDAHRKKLDYWKDQFKGAPSLLKLPTDRPRPAQQTFNGDDYDFSFGAPLSASVRQFCQQHNVTLFSVLLAAYQLVLSRYAQQNDICVAIPSAGRNRRELEGLIGFFVNVLIMRTRISDNPTVLDFVRGVKATALAGFENEDIPMEKIIEAIDIDWSPAYPPLAQVGFALQNIGSANPNGYNAQTSMQLGPITIEGIRAARKSAKYDMIFFVTEGDDFGGSIEYNTDLFDRTTIERLAGHVRYVLSQMVQNPARHLAGIALAAPDELAALLTLPANAIEAILPLTATHKDLYLSHIIDPDTLVNCLGQSVELRGDVDAAQVRSIAQRMVKHYAAMRTHIVASPVAWTDVAYWVVHRHYDIDFRNEDWSHEMLPEDEIRHRIRTRVYRPYDIHDTLHHFELIKVAEQRFIFVLIVNHIVLDASALTEFNRMLVAQLNGAGDALPADNFANYIPFALERFDTDENRDFWRTQLAQCEPLNIAVPARDYRRTLVSESFAIGGDRLAKIQEWCSSNDVSVPRLFKALYGILINTWARADGDFYIRDTLAGRSDAFRDTIGCLHQMEPFVFAQALQQPESLLADLFEHVRTARAQARPYSQISLLLQRRLADQGRCGFMYNYYSFEAPMAYHGAAATITTIPPLEIEGQVQLIVKPGNGEIRFDLHYYDHLLPSLQFLERLAALADQITLGCRHVGELSLLLPHEQQQLALWNPPGQVFEQFPVHVRFEQMAERCAGRIALSCDGAQWTFRDLNARANQIAHTLIASGVQVGDFVGLSMERSLNLIAGILGILKANAAYVPLDPHFPPERLAFILEDSEARVLLTHDAAGTGLDDFSGITVSLDRDRVHIDAQPTTNPHCHATPESTMYVLYTSGTTGRPKGCVVSHGNVARLMTATDDDFHFDENDVWTLFHSYAFDFTVWEMWGALLYGGKLVIVPYLLARSPDEFYELLLQQQVTVLNQTPSAFSQLIAADAARADVPALALRYVVFGGEALDFNALRTWVGRHGLARPQLVNMYGITETTVHVTRHTLTQTDFEQQGSIVGRPIRDLHVHIVDRNGRPVPIGIPGEMRIAGPGVTRGYLKRDDLTAERFTPNTFSELLPVKQRAQYSTLYHSGDLARFTANGDIEYLGRIDLQVKIRGHRIELGEIMAQLAALDEVREAVVIVREDVPGDPRLVAYLLLSRGLLPDGKQEIDLNSVRSRLKATLPDYMVPSNFVVLDAWPLTPTGKVDKKALPAPEGETARSTTYVAPGTDTERRLCTLWADLLGVKQVGVQDNFFELGGHSLLATRIVGRIRDEFKCEINLRALFEQPTVAALAQQIDGGSAPLAINKPPLVTLARDQPIPVSYAQQRLWIIDQLQPGTPVYNMPTVLRLSGDLDVAALERTFATLIERHESLRTTFGVTKGEPFQIIHAPAAFVLPQFEISDDELQLQARAAEFALAPFDLQTGPLFKVELWKRTQYSTDAGSDRGDCVVAVNMHHIVSDGVSVAVMLREIITLYAAYSSGMPNPLPPLPFQYADFSVWQRQWLQGDALDTQISYWKQQLLGVPMLELPTDYPRSSTQNAAGKQFTFEFSDTLSQKLRELAQRNGATLYQTLLAAFQLLLARLSRQDDIAVGSPIANRTQPELEPIIGFFVNTLVLRSQIDGDAAFPDFLAQIKQTTLDAYQHQDVSFEKLVDALNVPRELSHTPLFQVMFVLQNAAQAQNAQPVQIGNLAIAPLTEPGEEADCAAKFDITLALADTGAALGGMLEYRTALYKNKSMRALVAHFEALLTDIVNRPQARLRDYNILTNAEIEHQLIGLNAAVSSQLPQPARVPIHTRFEQMVARFGERHAITLGTQSVSYRELNTRANQIAHALRAQGINTGDYVGLCLERSIDLIAAMLGILKAGAAYVPLDAHFPAERLHYILQDSQARMLITETALLDVLPNFGGQRIVVDAEARLLTQQPGSNPDIAVPLDSTIYIIYTSGTTGKPKGCLLNHGNVARLFTATDDEFRLNEHDVWTLFHSFAFDFSVWEIWGALLFGGRLVIVPHAISRAPDEFYRLLINEGVTVLNQTPSAFSQLVAIDAMQAEPARHKLRCVVFGGEALDFNALRPWVKRYGLDAPRLINMYGITETTVHVTYYPLTQQDFDQGGSIIGTPIRDLHVHLLDAHGQLAPVGVPGEIHVSGPGVSDGYLKRPDLTAERFISNPFADLLPATVRAQHQRLYKSGDLARYLDNGEIEYLGRIDLQVKIRGHRIELGEIMAQLATLDEVREAIVVVREDAPGDLRLVAYLLKPADRDEIDTIMVRSRLKITLPDYMIPSTFVVMDAWPLTPNGKIDKKALPTPERGSLAADEFTAPRNDIEAQIAAIWQNLLGIDAISVNANFFELGGHSLLATQVMSRLREHFGIDLPLRTLFEQPTIEELAIAVAQSTAQSLLPPITPTDHTQPLPLSFNQQRLWFVQQLEPAGSAYNMPVALRIRGALDVDALEQAFCQLIQRHAVLRTRFVSVGDEPRQIIDARIDWQLARARVSVDQGINDDAARTAAITRLAAQQAAQPFDLACGPLLRATLYQLDSNDHVLVAVMHHIVSDGWSMQLIMQELAALYANTARHARVPLPILPIQYADFAVWQREHLQGDALQVELGWWQQQLHDAPRLLNLPTDRPRPPVQSERGAVSPIRLSSQLSQQVHAFAKAHQLTPFMVMLAAYQLLLAKYAGQSDICVGIPVAGRHQRETENLIGFFVNALIIRTKLEDNPRISTLLARVRDTLLGAFAHQDIPVETLIEHLKVPRALAYSPIAQVGFNYLPAAPLQKNLQLGELSFEPIDSGFVAAKYDMIWSFADGAEGISGGIEYRTDLFDQKTIAQMVEHYQQLLAALLEAPDCGVNALQWLPTAALYAALGLDAAHYERIDIATAMQRDLYLDTVLNPDNRRDYLGHYADVHLPLDVTRWQQAAELVHAGFSSLRTHLVNGQQPWLAPAYAAVATAQAMPPPFRFVDLTTEGISYEQLLLQMEQENYRPYPFDGSALYRHTVYRLADDHLIVLFVAHHAILDGIGVAAISQMFIDTYEALLRGESPQLPADVFADYYTINHQQIDSEEAIAYWREAIVGVEPLTAYVEPGKAGRSGVYHQCTLHVDREHLTAISKYCRAHRTTPAMYMKALYSVLLASVCNARGDFYFSEISLGRPKGHAMASGVYFEQTPFIVRSSVINDDSSMDDLLGYMGQVRKQMREGLQLSNAMQYALLPQSRMLTLFNFYPMPSQMTLLGVAVPSTLYIPQMDNCINFVGHARDGELELTLSYTDNVFANTQFLERLVHLSRQVVNGVNRLGDLTLTFAGEQPNLLDAVHKPRYSVESVQALFENQVVATPDAVAIEQGDSATGADSISYAALNRRANQLAHYLRQHHGIKRGDLVGCCFGPGIELMVAILGTIKAGAAYVPMDANYPQERLAYMLRDSNARVLLSESCLAERLPEADCVRVLLDRDADAIAALPQTNPSNVTELDDLLYVIYTSGSTGRPKGAGVKHRGELNLLAWYVKEFRFSRHDHTLIISAIGFDLTQKNLLAPLVSGGRVVMPQGGYDDQPIRALIEARQISIINCAPSAFYPLVENATDVTMLNSLRLVLFGGEPIRIEKLLPWLSHAQCAAQVVNMYGPTECTDIATFYRVTEPHKFVNQPIPIGKANDHVQLYVVDACNRLLPPGVPGELLIGGEGVGVGYLGKPELNEKAFIRNPFGEGTLYRTGDLVRQLPNGNLEFISRIDFQVKLRGLRIELGEIEFALRQLAGVTDAQVQVRDERLVAYVTATPEFISDLTSSPWRTQLASYLPDYMVPQVLVALPQWPLTPNGKIDRAALPSPDLDRSGSYVAPRNEIEAHIAAIWSEVLLLPQIGVEDDFFSLGGHSLLATKLVSRMRAQLGVDVSLRDLFNAHTVSAQAAIVATKRATSTIAFDAIKPVDRSQPLPLSFSQEQVWLLDQMQPGLAAYNIPLAARIHGSLNVEAMERSVALILARHEVLRSVFAVDPVSHHPYTIIRDVPDQPIKLGAEKIPEAQRAARAQQLATEEANLGFDLAQGPLMRVRLIRFDATDHLLLATQHHIVSDGWSMEILLRELGQTYVALTHGMQPQLPPLPVQYVDYAAWQRQWLHEHGQQQLQFWIETLTGAPPLLKLPTDRPRPAQQTFNGTHHRFVIDSTLATQIKELSERHNATLFMTLMAAWQLLLARYAGQKDIVVGLPNAGRGHIDTEALIGFFVNPMVLRTDLSDNCTIAELIDRVRSNSLNALAHANVPAELIIDALKIQRNPAYPPLAQVGFAMQNLPMGDTRFAQDLGDIRIELINNYNAVAKYDITLFMQEHNGNLEAAFEYNTDLFDVSTMERMGTHLLRLLQAMATEPEQGIDTIGLYQTDELIVAMQLPAAAVEHVLPVPPTMLDFYLASVMTPTTLANSVGGYFHIREPIDVTAWREEMQAVVNQYSMLRSRVLPCHAPAADIAYIVVSREQEVNFTFTDWSQRRWNESQLRQYLNQRCYRPYDVTRNALFGFELVKLADDHYVNLCFCHHMILDGAGISNILIQSSRNYFARSTGGMAEFDADLFPDFITESRQKFDTANVRAFWRNQLAAADILQCQSHVASSRDSEFIARSITVAPALEKSLRRYCRENRITPALYYKVLFGLLIGYYCRAESDFVMRDTLLGRKKSDEKGNGCYTESPPFVFPQHLINADTTIENLYNAVKEFTRASRDFTRLSILAQRQLLPANQVNFLYNFLTYDTQIPVADGFSPAEPLIPNEIEGHVQFIVFSGGSRTVLHLRYRNDVFADLDFLQRAIHVTEQLIGGVTHYGELKFCLPHEQYQLMSCAPGTINGTEIEYYPPQVLHHLFEQAVQQNSNAIAVSDERTQFTYAELNRRANQLAHHLRSLGVGPDCMVGVYMERAVSMSVALLAIHKAGGAYVPFDPSFPAERLQYMAEDAAVGVLLTQQHLLQQTPVRCTHTLCVDDANPQWATSSTTNLPAQQRGDHLFNVIYTSGSTGKPKGVMVLQEGVINRLLWMQQEYQLTPDDIVLQKTPYSFDVSVWELFWPLLMGARLHFAKPDGHKDPDYLRDVIVAEKVTTLHFVPSMLGIFLQTTGIEQCRSIVRVFCSGEALQLEHERRFFERLDFAELHNLYGPTEASIDVSYFQCLPGGKYPSVPIGKPVANTQLHVLDRELRPVPPGLAGELFIGGIQLARGYLNREQLTADTFIDNPYATGGHPSPKLYRTGDLTRYMADGNIEYIGRVDFQVKVRGLRIELGEIETQLHRHPSIKECLVTTYEKEPGNLLLVGYVVPEDTGQPVDQAALKDWLRQSLPEYMLPNAFVGIDAIPLSPNGKANRKALPLPVFEGQAGSEAYVAPRNELEQRLCIIWQEVLGVPQVGVHDNFFQLGGHSLLAIRLLYQVEAQLDVKLPLAQLFSAQTVADLALLIRTQSGEWSPLVPIKSRGSKPPLFLVHPIGAMVLCYEPLSRALPDDQPIYGLQARGLETGQQPFTDLPEMAAFYVEAIRRHQPNGPYYLGGQSLGGVVAYEMARQLQAAGEEIALLALMDSYIPNLRNRMDDASLIKAFIESNIGDIGLQLDLLRKMNAEQRIDALFKAANGAFSRDFIKQAIGILRGFNQMLVEFRPQAADLPVVLFRPEEILNQTLNRILKYLRPGFALKSGWDKLVGHDIPVHRVGGGHDSMLREPHVEALARILALEIADAGRNQ